MTKKWNWCTSHGSYIAGQAAIDGADATAVAMEGKWGCGRLRLLVSTALRERFDRQRYLFNTAIWHGDLEEVRRESERMTKAWQALDREADAAGAPRLDVRVWEVVLPDGSVAALVGGYEDAKAVLASDREVVVYTLEDVAKILGHWNELNKVMATFPGAKVEAVRKPTDPLDNLSDGSKLDDPIPDLVHPLAG